MNINQNKSKIIDKGKFKDKDKDKDKNHKKVSFTSSITMNKSLKKEPLNKNPQMVEEYFDDIYKYLKSIENSDLPKENYMKDVQKDINEKMRKILLDWLIDVHAKFKLLPETLFLWRTAPQKPYSAPFPVNTTATVCSRILKSRERLQLSIYLRSSFTTSSKSVMSERPLTCHRPVRPGVMEMRRR